LREGRPADALAPLREAALWAPGDAAILHDLGLACLETGLLGEAIASLQRSVAANPRYADAYLRLGIALEASGALQPALAAYGKAAKILPALADARYRAGNLLESLSRTGEAIRAFRRAAAASPKTTLGRIATARALLAENRDAEAEKTLRQALEVDRGNAAALELLGNLLADAGRFDEARDCLLRAIARAPLSAGCYYDVVRCRRLVHADEGLVNAMSAALHTPGLEPVQRSRLHLALGKAAQDFGDHEEAMRQFDAAAALRSTVSGFDLQAFEARVDRIIACFNAELIGRARPAPGNRAAPIFIVGMPRSGTTLAEQIISAHPAVHAGGELPFWNERGQLWEHACAVAPDAAWLSGAAADYASVLRGMAPGHARVTDKMPLNFLWAGLIHLALPDATIIHCRRRPIDTALSIHQTHFNARMAFPTGGADLVGYFRAYQRLCAHWRRVLPPGRFVDIDYETLTANPQPVIRHMIAACGLPWDESCLRPERNTLVIKTPSKWQARQPIYHHAAGRWLAYRTLLGPLGDLLDDHDNAAESATGPTAISVNYVG
jgi:tetratricopeptide (TPR) repeat protein